LLHVCVGSRRRPYSVVLFDEVEKAHNDVFNILLQARPGTRAALLHTATGSPASCGKGQERSANQMRACTCVYMCTSMVAVWQLSA